MANGTVGPYNKAMLPAWAKLAWLLVAAAAGRVHLPDGGPWYVETNLDRVIAEPCNAASALLFVVVGVYWLVRLQGQYRRHLFLSACLPLLILGGLAGTLYHAFRSHRVFLLVDWLSIVALCSAGGGYLWYRATRRWWIILPVVVATVGLQRLLAWATGGHGIAIGYLLAALLTVLPSAVVLVRMRFRHGWWMTTAVGLFLLALVFRSLDAWMQRWMPMGSHWLWHVLGTAAAWCLIVYLYRLGPAAEEGPVSPAACDRAAETLPAPDASAAR